MIFGRMTTTNAGDVIVVVVAAVLAGVYRWWVTE